MSWLPLLVAETDYWAQSFFGLDDGKRFVILIIAISCGTGFLTALGGMGMSILRHRADNELKRDMLDRGMSAEEITQIISAKSASDDSEEG